MLVWNLYYGRRLQVIELNVIEKLKQRRLYLFNERTDVHNFVYITKLIRRWMLIPIQLKVNRTKSLCCMLYIKRQPRSLAWGVMDRKGPFFHPAPKPRKSPWERGWLKERYIEYLGSLKPHRPSLKHTCNGFSQRRPKSWSKLWKETPLYHILWREEMRKYENFFVVIQESANLSLILVHTSANLCARSNFFFFQSYNKIAWWIEDCQL